MKENSLDTNSLTYFPTCWETNGQKKVDKLKSTLFQRIKSASGKFAGLNFDKGLKELKQRAKYFKLNVEKTEKLFVAIFSEDVEDIFKQVKDLNFNTPINGAVFYSGEEGKKAAWYYAQKIGSKAIEQTPGGNLFETWDWFNEAAFKVKYWEKPKKGNDQAIVWAALSKAYASKAQGIANVFQSYKGNIWEKIRKTCSNGSQYKILYPRR